MKAKWILLIVSMLSVSYASAADRKVAGLADQFAGYYIVSIAGVPGFKAMISVQSDGTAEIKTGSVWFDARRGKGKEFRYDVESCSAGKSQYDGKIAKIDFPKCLGSQKDEPLAIRFELSAAALDRLNEGDSDSLLGQANNIAQNSSLKYNVTKWLFSDRQGPALWKSFPY